MKAHRHYIIAAVFAVVLLISSLIGGVSIIHAAATTSAGSHVLDDLKKDENFNAGDYPSISDDYSLQVIQIAESSADELLIYVYQPAAKAKLLTAVSIDIGREQNNTPELSFKNYDLELLNSAGVFFKYRVKGFELRNAAVRYYNISNILRRFDSSIDKEPAEGNISEMPNRVAQLWTAETVGDSVTYSMETSEVITITQKIAGYCTYDDGLNLGWGVMEGITKAYFVAFDTDRPIEKLISADLTFWVSRAHCKLCCNSMHKDHDYLYDFHDPEYIDYGTGVYNNEPLTITDEQYWGNQGGGNIRPATKFLRKRIRTTEEFLSDENNKDYELIDGSKLDGTKWVLNFYEAQDKYKLNNVWLSFIPGITMITGIADGEVELNDVYDVQILRLEFETDGKHYNLGVVDNKQTPSDKPFNTKIEKGFFDWLAEKLGVSKLAATFIFWGIIALIVFAILMPVLSVIFPPFGALLKAIAVSIGIGLKHFFVGLWLLISAPFRLIAKAIKKHKAKPKKTANKNSSKHKKRKKAGKRKK